MMIDNNLLAKILKEKMQYTTAKHSIISSNIANISTPLARTKDLSPFASVFNHVSSLQLSTTKENHIEHKGRAHSYPVVYSNEGAEEKLNGNNISLDNESMKLSRNNLEHNKAISIYHKMLSMFNIAIGSR